MTTHLDDIMEQASQALAALDYPQCEALCLRALAQARDAKDWQGYSRVVLPLQEARRQKRQAALDGRICLGTEAGTGDLCALLDGLDAGCIVVTPPYTTDDAARLDAAARAGRRPIEILYASPDSDGRAWAVHSYHGLLFEAIRPAPPEAFRGGWHAGQQGHPVTPAHWFMQASEALGNAAIHAAQAPLGSGVRLDQLEQALPSVGDHELLHQALADAARAMHRGSLT